MPTLWMTKQRNLSNQHFQGKTTWIASMVKGQGTAMTAQQWIIRLFAEEATKVTVVLDDGCQTFRDILILKQRQVNLTQTALAQVVVVDTVSVAQRLRSPWTKSPGRGRCCSAKTTPGKAVFTKLLVNGRDGLASQARITWFC